MALAVLFSKCGELHFFDQNSLSIAFSTLQLEKHPGAEHGIKRSEVPVGSGAADKAFASLYDGFTIEQWAAYGKKKAKIATTVSKDNGALKAKIDAMETNTGGGLPSACDVLTSSRVDPVSKNDPWARSAQELNYHMVKEVAARNTDDDLDVLSNCRPQQVGLGVLLEEVKSQQMEWDDAPDDGDESPFTSFHADSEAAQQGSARNLGGEKSNVKHLKGDWRSLHSGDFQKLYTRFPGNPFKVAPHEYIQNRWPSCTSLLNAASHWQRYGYSATLPDYMYHSAESSGCYDELQDLRIVFRDAGQAKTKGWI